MFYRASDAAAAFLDVLSGDYVKALHDRAQWVTDRFASVPDDELLELADGMDRSVGRRVHAAIGAARGGGGGGVTAGFSLRELRLTGAGVEDAVLDFADGLNVVAGPSDTGKTFVAQCLSFLMGNGKTPKQIPEAAPYEQARVVLVARTDGATHTLARRARRCGHGRAHRRRRAGTAPAVATMTQTAPTRCRLSCWRWRRHWSVLSGCASTGRPVRSHSAMWRGCS